MPTITVLVLAISGWTTRNAIWFVPLLIVSTVGRFFLVAYAVGTSDDRWLLLRLPLAGKLLVQMTTAQAARSLATLLAGGITIVESWEIAAESITNLELRQRSSAILPLIREGRSFTESLETANWMPELAIDMIGIGERSGQFARDAGRSGDVL